VRDLELQPDAAKQNLNANIRLVASLPEKCVRHQFETRNRKGKMKTTTLFLILFLTASTSGRKPRPPCASRQPAPAVPRARQHQQFGGRPAAPVAPAAPAAPNNAPGIRRP